MDPVCAGRVDRTDFLAQFGEIGAQDRRGNADGMGHGLL
jgi:hypothetical protein